MKDSLGREIELYDWIAYAVRVSNSGALKCGYVVDLSDDKLRAITFARSWSTEWDIQKKGNAMVVPSLYNVAIMQPPINLTALLDEYTIYTGFKNLDIAIGLWAEQMKVPVDKTLIKQIIEDAQNES